MRACASLASLTSDLSFAARERAVDLGEAAALRLEALAHFAFLPAAVLARRRVAVRLHVSLVGRRDLAAAPVIAAHVAPEVEAHVGLPDHEEERRRAEHRAQSVGMHRAGVALRNQEADRAGAERDRGDDA